jgi:predicted TPR repeat methyltransferase
MSNVDLEQAKAFFLQGLQCFQSGDWAAAEQHFEQALELAPGRISVVQNLGVTRVRLGRYAQALPLLSAALAADSQELGVWQAQAQAQLELGQINEAIVSYERCLALGDTSVTLRARYAQCLSRQGRIDEAMRAYQNVLASDPHHPIALTELGSLYREAGQLDEAARHFRLALDHGADAELVGYFLAAVTHQADVPAPPRQYVQQLFDDYASDFDKHLVGTLGYRGHALLVDRLPAAAGPRFANALDLGCGTGLCGAHVRARVERLTGVDLAPAMVEQARQRGVYDALHVDDIHDFLARPQAAYDLVLAADVFIYVGALDPVFAQLAASMRPGGWLAFTIESAAEEQTVELLPSLRYAHGSAYLRDLARRHGFGIAAVHDEVIRMDQQTPVQGQYVYLQRR